MNFDKKTFIAGLALFSMFFGAGNLILPPYIGNISGESWILVTLGFLFSGVVIPILAVMAHGKLQGTMYDFGKKVSPWFSILFCLIIYAIAVTLPAPRTAAVTYEMAIQPFFEIGSIWVSGFYFILVMIFALNRSKVISILGRYLTPIIVFILIAIILITIFSEYLPVHARAMEQPFRTGMLEGYQTYDAIGGIVVGAVLIISLRIAGEHDYHYNRKLINGAGIISGIGLGLIYTGLILVGASTSGEFESEIGRTALLSGVSQLTLGNAGSIFLSVLVGLACFTTAVGIVTGTADYFKGLFNESDQVYRSTVIISCILGVLIGQFDVHYIIVVAIPVLMFIYPLTIIMILLNVLPDRWINKITFRVVVVVTLLFSIPDFLGSVGVDGPLVSVKSILPLGSMSLGWLLPAVLAFILSTAITNMKKEVDIQ